jgi:molybdopterin-guanine dinucleotide biosynthesis protein A
MTVEAEIVGVILAGGKSSRMGRNKALIEREGLPLIAHVAQTLQRLFRRVLIVADDAEPYRFLRLPVFPDLFKDAGPLGGIHAGFVHSGAKSIFVSACDTPCLSPALIEYIIRYPSETSVKVAQMDGELHPLCGLYARPALPFIQHALENGELQVKKVLHRLKAAEVAITDTLRFYHPLLLKNFNTPADVESWVEP